MSAEQVMIVVATTSGGTGRHVRVLVDALVASGVDVTVCGPSDTEASFGFTEGGARFVAVPIGGSPHPRDVRTVRTLRAYARDADVVHAHSLRAGALAALAVPRGTPLVVTLHNAVLATGPAASVHHLLERVVARRATVVLGVSPDLVERSRSLGARDARLAPVSAPVLPAPARDAANVRADLGVPDGVPLLLTVARLHAQKGLHDLVAAAALLADRHPRPTWVVAGDGPQRAEIAAASADLEGVRLLGTRDDVADLLAAADVVVLPSHWEGSPLSVAEALRAGRPFVGTAVGGVPTMVGDAGLLVPARAPHELAQAIARVLDDPGLAADLGARAVRAAAALPSDADVVTQVREAYADARATVGVTR